MDSSSNGDMGMRSGQGGHVSHTTALAAFSPKQKDGGAVQPPMADSATFVFPCARAGEASFVNAYGLPAVKDEFDAEGNPIPKPEPGLIYARLATPAVSATEAIMKSLEPEADWAFLFPSGMAAATTLLQSVCHLQLGGEGVLGSRLRDVVIYGHPVYGGTHALMENLALRWGFKTIAVDMRDLSAVEDLLCEYNTRIGLVFCETPANPTMSMVDLKAVAELIDHHFTSGTKPVFAVDNTFAGVFQNPLTLGADIVYYSATKYLGGHADLIGGFLVGRNGPMCAWKSFMQGVVEIPVMNAVHAMRTILGYTSAPEMAVKLGKHMQTYKLRMDRQAYVASVVASWLVEQEKVAKIFFPTLLTGKDAELYHRQMSGPSAMIAIQFKDDTRESAFRFLDALQHVLLAVSLGFVRSLAEHPSSMTHSDISPELQMSMGITPGLIRLSIGIEEPDDIIKDLTRALAAI